MFKKDLDVTVKNDDLSLQKGADYAFSPSRLTESTLLWFLNKGTREKKNTHYLCRKCWSCFTAYKSIFSRFKPRFPVKKLTKYNGVPFFEEGKPFFST